MQLPFTEMQKTARGVDFGSKILEFDFIIHFEESDMLKCIFLKFSLDAVRC